MNAQAFIESRLKKMQEVPAVISCDSKEELKKEILRLLLSKKFRKYAANEDLIEHCKNAIDLKVENNEPINITFVHGAYKLWRLEESPYADWAELFSLMYYTNWVKNICAMYEPGVHFDFFADDWIVPIMNNVPMSDVDDYLSSFNKLLIFLKPYQPKNLDMTITPVGTQFESKEEFEDQLYSGLKALQNDGLPELDDSDRLMIEHNVKTTPEQEADPEWREKVRQFFLAYAPVKKAAGYHYRPEKILAFTQPLPSGSTISVGTTKSSVMKFWVGAGVLNPKNDSYVESILSVAQLKESSFEKQEIEIEGLEGENFDSINVLSD